MIPQIEPWIDDEEMKELAEVIKSTWITENKKTEEFEKSIDFMMKYLPPTFNFVLPGGSRAGAFLHQARTVARRAERNLVRLSKKEKVDERVMKYINRLSDLFYAAARFANRIEKKKETIWSR